jgi:hypothetical protein
VREGGEKKGVWCSSRYRPRLSPPGDACVFQVKQNDSHMLHGVDKEVGDGGPLARGGAFHRTG